MKSKNLAKAIALGLVLGSMSFVSMEAQAANLNGPVGGNAARYSDLQAVNNQVETIDNRVETMDQVLSNKTDKEFVIKTVDEEKTEREKEDTRIEGKVDTETNRAQNEEKRIEDKVDANTDSIADVNGKVGDAQYSSENYIGKGDDLTTAAGKLDAAVKAEETERQNEDARIEGKVDTETNRAQNEEKRIEGKVDKETNRAQNEEKRIEQKFDGEVSRLDSKIDKLDNRVEKVGAMAAAIANLHTMGYDPAAPTEVAVGVGQYRDKTGLALGAFHYPNRDVMVSFSISTAGEEYMAGVGATWKFGRKSPEAMLKAEKEKAARKKLAQETAAKKAAEDAAVAVQQAKHSEMLAAESK